MHRLILANFSSLKLQVTNERVAILAVTGLLLLMAVNLFAALLQKELTNDEVIFIPAGYYHLRDGNFQFNNEHPPLAKIWAALPFLFVKPIRPPSPITQREVVAEAVWNFHARFWHANKNRFQVISFLPRAIMILVPLVLGWLIFVYARMLFDSKAAILAVAIYTLEPTFLAHGRTAYNDVAAALAYLAFFVVVTKYWQRPTYSGAALVGATLGTALLTKFSLIILVPLVFCLIALASIKRKEWGWELHTIIKGGAISLVAAVFVINAGYFFQSPGLSEADLQRLLTKSPTYFESIRGALALGSYIFPTYFLVGLFHVLVHNQYGHPASLLGMHSLNGWWYYFPVAFALKTTLPHLLISTVALGWSCYRAVYKRDMRFLALLVPFVIYAAGCMFSRMNIGIRHLLPALPFLFILGGALGARLLKVHKLGPAISVAGVVLFGWMAVDTFRAYPHYMSYMNQLTLRERPWSYLSDSNIEYGDDVAALARYLRGKGETQVRAALLGGWATLPMHGVEYVDFVVPAGTSIRPTRYVALGASFLNGSSVPSVLRGGSTELFASYRDQKPEAIFGNSIFLYKEN